MTLDLVSRAIIELSHGLRAGLTEKDAAHRAGERLREAFPAHMLDFGHSALRLGRAIAMLVEAIVERRLGVAL